MNTRELRELGVPEGATPLAIAACRAAGLDRDALRGRMLAVMREPSAWASDATWGPFAAALVAAPASRVVPRAEPVAWAEWGELGIDYDQPTRQQMESACRLPVAAAGALMPDAHVGYGLPIGGVLATRNAVIPYAVGVDIACRMRLTVLDIPARELEDDRGRNRLRRALETETRFGVGGTFKHPREHPVLDRDWGVSPVTMRLRDKARSQLGTSGSGNHFVEFGTITIGPEVRSPEGGAAGREAPAKHPFLELPEGVYLALLSHSGSRGTGAAVCHHYSKLAMELHELPGELKHLAWLDLDSEPGAEYFAAMNLMGEYAAANHACIHEAVLKHLSASALATVENHHNFAWLETHDVGQGPEPLVVHRKGATPAGAGVLGVIPGSMAAPGFVVMGRGVSASLNSASHGAGRQMSRTQARKSMAWGEVRQQLDARGVSLISAGLDEAPGAYKDIHRVMAQQRDLVHTLARFDPRLVLMAPEGERAED